MFKVLGTFEFHPKQWEKFRSGELREYWAKSYPDIFDAQDIAVASNQAQPTTYHFYEWLAAVLIYQSFGYLSLVEKYQFKRHKRKQAILREFLTPEELDLVTNHKEAFGNFQNPDLFVYAKDRSDWFFCEVKGPKDRLREAQIKYFNALRMVCEKDIRIVYFKEAKT